MFLFTCPRSLAQRVHIETHDAAIKIAVQDRQGTVAAAGGGC